MQAEHRAGDTQEVAAHIAKQRQGPTGIVELVFFKTTRSSRRSSGARERRGVGPAR